MCWVGVGEVCWVGVGGKGLWCEEEQRCVCVWGGGGGGAMTTLSWC